MANNTAIAIQRLTVSTAEDAILRSLSLFDPKGSASWSSTRSKSPVSSLVDLGQVGTSGIATVALDTLRQPASFTWSQLLPSGATYNVQYLGVQTDY